MTRKEILIAYKEGKLSTAEVREKLRELDRQSGSSSLSEGQKGLWMLQKISPDMSAYNIPLCFRIQQKLDIEKFKKACGFLLEQYPILQCVVEEKDGVSFKMVSSSQPLAFFQEDISSLASHALLPYLRSKVKEAFSLEHGPLLRIYLLPRTEQEHIVLINIHHIIFDGSSILPLVAGLLEAYRKLVQGETLSVVPSQASYADFVEWEQKMLAGKEGEEHRAYWKRQLAGTLPVLELPVDKPRSSARDFQGQVYTAVLPQELGRQVKSLAASQHAGLSSIFLGIFKTLLYRYTGQEDIIVGIPTIGRPEERFYSQIGYFINMIPIYSRDIGGQPFSRLVRELELTLSDGLDHAAYPFPALVRELKVQRTQSSAPVFQVAFAYQNFVNSANLQQVREQYKDTLPIEFINGIHQEGDYEFELEVSEQERGFILNFKYNPELFDLSTIQRMAGNYINLTQEVVENPELRPEEYAFLSAEEQKTILFDFNMTKQSYPKDKCFHELFEQQAEKTPEAVAAVYEEKSLTYRELDEKSTHLAIYLQAQGVKPDSMVAICMERSLEMLVGLLGILKSGGAYMPLDPDYPAERLEYMLEDSKASLLLSQPGLEDKLSWLSRVNIKTILLEENLKELEQAAKGKTLKREVRPDHLAYVIYTSGSTGKPKGVMVTQQGLTNFLVTMGNEPGLKAQDRLLAVTTYCFDIAGLELYLPLLKGAQCHICSAEKIKDAEKLAQEIRRVKPTVMQATPATWIMLFHTGWKNKEKVKILCGGEALPEALKQQFIAHQCDVWNMFGPTETTIWSTIQHITADEPITIGKPIANTYIYIVDKNLRLTPIGVPGELCIAGDGLARGYLNQPQLTAEKFTANPFAQEKKLYKTGDLARWLPDGNIEFLGRMDHQVKLRGFRIELGEIETQLGSHPKVRECAVVVKEHEGNKQLIAYYIPENPDKEERSMDPQQLRDYLRLTLPKYMLPAFFIALDRLPLTLNGKVDRKELMNRKIAFTRTKKNRMPQSNMEEKMLSIWKDILGVIDISTEDGFFDVGGDSVLAVKVVERLKKELDCEISVTALFKYSNIKEFSSYIASIKGDDSTLQDTSEEKADFRKLPAGNINHTPQDSAKDYPAYYRDSMAIIGISCCFPGANHHTAFWDNLREGRESIRFFTKEELRGSGLPEEIIQDLHYVPMQSTIEEKDLFDPGFFNISARDAEFMDPQFRLLLLNAWKAIEDAGYAPRQIPGTSVFISASNSFYQASLHQNSSGILKNADEYVSWILAQGGTIPTMISHKLGLKGPSFYVHSNCSSSLVGLYSAYQTLRSGEAKYALVGGATVFPHTNLGYLHQQGLNFSSDGHIKAFDASADGMVSGEGVAVILLKRAIDAISDGDHIYALLRGIGVNNDGADKVGFYAPSVKGQSEVIQKVLDDTQVNPETISYVEAHGTGTKLGDPIEFTALSDVYKQYTARQKFCGIGSVKTNIGHLDTAAGLAGCIKVALSLYHGEIPPSLHYKEPNPNMEITDSPFYIVDRLKKLEDTQVPHRAALSSFGIGGTNAHAIFEQYIPDVLECDNSCGPYVVPLSARNPARLKEYAQKLKGFLEAQSQGQESLNGLAYTFQVGREPMESRVAFVTDSARKLVQALEEYIAGKEKIVGCFQGEAKKENVTVRLFEKDEDFMEVLRKWAARGELEKVAELWAKGLKVDWGILYPGAKPHRQSLPTYPFARECYRLPVPEASQKTGQSQVAYLHPLLHQNTSDFSEQRFSSAFTGREFFLADHLVKGVPVLPGVASLEMVRAAMERAAGIMGEGWKGIRLKNVVWVRPIALGKQALQVHIGLSAADDGQITYRIYGGPEAAGGEPVLYGQGMVEPVADVELPRLDIKALQAQFDPSGISSEEFYHSVKIMGVDYGSGYRGLEALYGGEGQILAKLSLPACVADTEEQYVLHPSMMDSAIQASIGLQKSSGRGDAVKMTLPFALQELEMAGRCTSSMWAFIRYSEDSGEEHTIQKVDIDLCDLQGNVCIRMKGFSSRVLEGGIQTSSTSGMSPAGVAGEPLLGTTLLTPVWDKIQTEKGEIFPASTERIVIVGGNDRDRSALQKLYPQAHILEIRQGDTIEAMAEEMEAYGPIDHILWIASEYDAAILPGNIILEARDRGVLFGYRIVKALLHAGYGTRDLGWTIITAQALPIYPKDAVNPADAAVHGLVGSIANEYPHWKIRCIDLEAEGAWPVYELFALPDDGQGNFLAYRGGEWYQQRLIPLRQPFVEKTLYRTEGVYVVIGGAGGIGEVWSEYMIRTYKARIVWIGRREKDAAIQAKLNRLSTLGSAPVYIATDAADRNALQQAYEEVKKLYAQVHGVIHSALVLQDQSLANMEEEVFRAGLTAKIDVSVRIAQVFAAEPLDFVLFFSSINSFTSFPGQSNYTSGCTFQDAFAHQLALQWPCAVKVVNWGYWGNVGVVASKAYQDRMALAGIGSIEPPEAMAALETLLAGSVDQIVLVKATKPLSMPKINSGELISVYSEELAPHVGELKEYILASIQEKQDAQMHILLEEGSRRAKEFEELLCKLLWGQLRSMGLYAGKKPVVSGLYDRWLKESMEMLVRGGYLTHDGVAYAVKDHTPVDLDAGWKEWDEKKGLWLKDPNMKAQVPLVEATLRNLPEILAGNRPATDIVFPDSSMKLVEGVYKDNYVVDYFNEAVAGTIVAYIEERLKQDASTRVRILEIGAGTGGTSTKVFQRLQPYREQVEEYCYTDISKAFLLHAEKEYGPGNPYLTYKLFNVEDAPTVQGVDAGRYDIAIATNVLHATKNIRQTLRNAKAIIKKNGLLVLNEISKNNLFSHLTFGLLEGWWLYEDAALRISGCPAVAPETWKEVLEQEGFRSVFFPAQGAIALGQQIIVGESDGMIRQKRKTGQVGAPGTQKSNTDKTRHQVPKRAPGIPAVQSRSQSNGMQKGGEVTGERIQEYVRTVVRASIAEVLKMEEAHIQDDRSFSEYGVDSIIVVNLVNLLNKRLKIMLQTTVLFDYNNVKQLVPYITGEYRDILTAFLQETAPIAEAAARPVTAPALDTSVQLKTRFRVHGPEKLQQIARVPAVNGESPAATQKDAIAIIGMSGQFAKSKNVHALWEHLASGADLMEEVSRWDLSEQRQGKKKYCSYGSFVDDIDKFDPLFFNISGREAVYMAPRQRFFLEESWKALEDAGYAGTVMEGRQCGVYVGCGKADYDQLFEEDPPPQAFWGNDSSIIPARIAYYLNLQGPAVAIDTACSSSLVAMHIACQALWAGEIEMALAGGVYINCTPGIYIIGNRAEMLSPTGRCHTFDESADGFVPGEGVGVLLLKRLQEAVTDGDHIYGVIRGSGINQDGRTNGITAPSALSQERLERRIYDTFHINPEKIGMIEAHGTGTKLGDPIEYNALTRAFRAYTNKVQYCAIGSIKTNLGHAAYAAGVAGVIKILLSLQHKKIPPSLHFRSGNPNIQFEGSPFFVNTELKDWKAEPGEKRCAAFSSFGFGGTNAHIVIEEAPENRRKHRERPGYLIALSARNMEQLKAQVRQLAGYCEKETQLDCGNMSYTLLTGRRHLNHRWACVAHSREELAALLKQWLDTGKSPQVYASELHENEYREQSSLKQHGNECIKHCKDTADINAYIEQLSVVAELYVQGYTLEFEQLFSDDTYSKIPLPTYPFARESYWVPGKKGKTAGKAEAAALQAYSSHASTENSEPEEVVTVYASSIPSLIGSMKIRAAAPRHSGISMASPSQQSVNIGSLRDEIQTSLLQIVADLLQVGVEEVDASTNLEEYGLCPVMLTAFTDALNQKFNTELTAAVVAEYQTIRHITEYIVEQHRKMQGTKLEKGGLER